jgi:predicted nucleotide-binding protein
MEKQIASLVSISEKCKTAARQFKEHGFDQQLSLLDDVIRKVERASSNSWLGYQANIYYNNFEPPKPGDHFSKEWGFQGSSLVNPVSQNWREYAPEDVKQYIMTAARFSEKTKLIDVATETEKLFDKLKDELVIVLTVTLEETSSEVVEGYRDDAKNLKSYFSSQSLLEAAQPSGQFMSRDSLAMSQGFVAPPHIGVRCWAYSLKTYFSQIEELANIAERSTTYLRQKFREDTPERSLEGKIFIGHGRSLSWRDLSTFLSERLNLEWDEFNRESTAGISIKERLETMLDQASFAFLIMTAEDEHADNTLHARENVIHEVGLFQGRLTFRRAIVLLEEGCQEFSNIHGIGQIRFPKGNMKAAFEDIRLVLEREGLINT